MQMTIAFCSPSSTTPLEWPTMPPAGLSLLTDRTEYISNGLAKSKSHTVTCGVLQGSFLGLILFILFLIPLGQVIRSHRISIYCSADDTQLMSKPQGQPHLHHHLHHHYSHHNSLPVWRRSRCRSSTTFSKQTAPKQMVSWLAPLSRPSHHP